MSVLTTVEASGVRVPIGRDRVARLIQGVMRAERRKSGWISIAFVTAAAIARLNRQYVGHRGPTDIISFGFRDSGRAHAIVGDIYIAPEIAARNAKRFGVGVREEMERLVIHGTLHVLGHEHPEGDGRTRSPMWRRQEVLLRRLGGRV